MSKFGEKLQRLAGQGFGDRASTSSERAPAVSARHERLGALRAELERMGRKITQPAHAHAHAHEEEEDDPFRERMRSFDLASSVLPGERSEGPEGSLRTVRRDFPEDHYHGTIPVASALAASAADLALLALDPTLATVDFSRALYIDTETTGLAGGAGTLPFLIGMAWFEGSRLCVEQLLLEQPGLEAPMLRRLAERMAQASALVSYNGKSFDWPLLRTRFVLARVPAPPLPPHLDLLHCARRVYKRRLGSVRLVNLEEEILGFVRVDDMPGALIPDTYLGFLRGHVPAAALVPIVEHNRNDLVALAAVLGEITRRFSAAGPEQDARDQLGFAGVAARVRSEESEARALSFAAGAAEADLRGELAPEAHLLSGELCLRKGDSAAAEVAFRCALEAASGRGELAARAHLALAKLYEHQLKRFEDAIEHARGAHELEGDEPNARRLARLARKSEARAQRTGRLALEIRD